MSTTAPRIPIHALVFELDGLFIESDSLAGEAIAALFRWYGCKRNPGAEAGQRLTYTRLRDTLAVVTGMCGQGVSCDALAREFEELGLTLLQDLVQPTSGATEPIAYPPEPGALLALATSAGRRDTAPLLTGTRRTGAPSVEFTGGAAARAAIGFPASSHSCRGG